MFTPKYPYFCPGLCKTDIQVISSNTVVGWLFLKGLRLDLVQENFCPNCLKVNMIKLCKVPCNYLVQPLTWFYQLVSEDHEYVCTHVEIGSSPT